VTRPGDNQWHSKRQRALAFAAALILAATLAGCTTPDAGLQRETARQLQEQVLSVSQAAAGNDHAAALKALERLESDLSAASASGRVSEDRRRTIMTAVAAVRADLTAAEAQARSAADAAEQAKADAEAAEKAARETSVPVVPAPAPAEDNGKGNAGKGKGKG
jgi:septal ring factor EnvC (AmiA/AmiB activator)